MAEPELGQPFCGLTSAALAEAARGACKWTHSPVSIAHAMDLPRANITPDQIDGVFREVCALWSGVCGIDLRFQADPNANIFARVEPMDGPNGVLGESYLPCGNVNPRTQLTQRYDQGERWTLSFLKRVVLHEVGHALGLDHAPKGSAVMSPYLTEFAAPQSWDVSQMQARYGPPVAKPIPPDEPPSPAGETVVVLDRHPMNVPGSVVVNLAEPGTYGFRLQRLPRVNRVSVSLFRR